MWTRFIGYEKILPFFRNLLPIASTKTYDVLDPQVVKYIEGLGDVCSRLGLLPTSTELTEGFEKEGTMAMASGGRTDIWRGKLNGAQVAIKALRVSPNFCPTEGSKEAKKVRQMANTRVRS